MRIFLTIWLGQLGSNVGSRMTSFAMTLWAWDLTQQATALALVGFFTQLPQMLSTPFAGVIVDRYSRKQLMMAGDAAAALSTVVILWLYTSDQLQIWHLYGAGAINGMFGQLQQLAYTASMTLMVPERQYSRALSLNFLSGYGANILGPAIAGAVYPLIGLTGILLIDLGTFAIATFTILSATIPQPQTSHTPLSLRKDLAVGFHYLWQRPGMVGILVVAALFQFIFQITSALHAPMILARSGGSAQVLATVYATAGIGGVVGAALITTWGGPRPRIYGVLLGMIGAGLSRTGFSVGRSLALWMPMQFCLSFNFPMMGSSGNAIWLSKVPPDLQGRVFSTSVLIKGLVSPLGRLLAGPLADRVFEPAMMPGGRLVPIFGSLFGTGHGAGMAVICGIASIAMTLVGLCGFLYQPLRTMETTLPDHGAASQRRLGDE
ncbi:MAG: MFS transporter [Cyanobacteria bacterium P01_C01_bin.118]